MLTTMKALILAGGQSSRMGKPKHLLELNGMPLYARLTEVLHSASPEVQIYISLNKSLHLNDEPSQLEVLCDLEEDIGPAAGLLAAYEADCQCEWLVIACDFPLVRSLEIRQLINNYQYPLTCFKNAEGFTEPLLAIWSPAALHALKDNVAQGLTSPNRIVKMLNGSIIQPVWRHALMNTNTPQEWEQALELTRSSMQL